MEFNEFDAERLLWEEINGLVYLMREVNSPSIDGETVEQTLKEPDKLNAIVKIQKPENPSDFHSNS